MAWGFRFTPLSKPEFDSSCHLYQSLVESGRPSGHNCFCAAFVAVRKSHFEPLSREHSVKMQHLLGDRKGIQSVRSPTWTIYVGIPS